MCAPAARKHAVRCDSLSNRTRRVSPCAPPPLSPGDVVDLVEEKKRLLDVEVAARVRALEAEQALSSALSRRAQVLRALMQAVEQRDALLAAEADVGDGGGMSGEPAEALAEAEREIEALETKVRRVCVCVAGRGGVLLPCVAGRLCSGVRAWQASVTLAHSPLASMPPPFPPLPLPPRRCTGPYATAIPAGVHR